MAMNEQQEEVLREARDAVGEAAAQLRRLVAWAERMEEKWEKERR